MTREHSRLHEPHSDPLVQPWRKWGPFVSDRAWGTVREDYSSNGQPWDFLPHDLARSKAYRWGEDGIAGICDRYQILVFALALWNGRDPILKERFFGLTNTEGNHGEDVKEYYFYLDNTPTHSYMKMLYKYPQREYPYAWLIEENRRRGTGGHEFELLDTGIFEEDRYFDVFVEYAKASPEDICIRIEAFNRGPETAELYLLPHLWFRKTWGWCDPSEPAPDLRFGSSTEDWLRLEANDSSAPPLRNLREEYRLGLRHLYAQRNGAPLFTFNETNAARVFGPGSRSQKPYVKDAFHRYLVNGESDQVNSELFGTKACIVYKLLVESGESTVLRLRLTPAELDHPLESIDGIMAERRRDADEFYATVHPPGATDEERMIQRQAFAGLLWSKQIYLFDMNLWLEGDNPAHPPPESRKHIRNAHWRHLNSMRILSMPDKWEYPWFAAWDLAFQCITMALVDPEFAKDNLWFLLFEQFQHINGQIPAYEWEFSELNPPVHAWACWRIYKIEQQLGGHADRAFLEKCFHKLLINFTWWVNKVDSQGNNVFEGGFLGLDNITVVDRGEKLPGGAILEQSDGTGWMAFFCIYMMRIALELAKDNMTYEGLATKFFEHFIYIGAAMKNMAGRDFQLWDDRDGFFYDVLRYPNGEFHRFRVRSLVGVIPLFAVAWLDSSEWIDHPEFRENVEWFCTNRPDLTREACTPIQSNEVSRLLLSIVGEAQLRRLIDRMWNSDEFLSDSGLRSLSKYHLHNPFWFGSNQVGYEPAEQKGKIKGGNSNWRGPIWFPISYLMIESLVEFSKGYDPSNEMGAIDLRKMAGEFANRLIGLFRRDIHGRRPVFGDSQKFQEDQYWRDCLLFYEYFHGDNGAGLGASHQTGWTALVANLISEWRQ